MCSRSEADECYGFCSSVGSRTIGDPFGWSSADVGAPCWRPSRSQDRIRLAFGLTVLTIVSYCHSWKTDKPARVRTTRHRLGVDLNPSDEHSRDQHLGQSGAEHGTGALRERVGPRCGFSGHAFDRRCNCRNRLSRPRGRGGSGLNPPASWAKLGLTVGRSRRRRPRLARRRAGIVEPSRPYIPTNTPSPVFWQAALYRSPGARSVRDGGSAKIVDRTAYRVTELQIEHSTREMSLERLYFRNPHRPF